MCPSFNNNDIRYIFSDRNHDPPIFPLICSRKPVKVVPCMSKALIAQTELGPASQYFSTTLTAPPNLKPFAQSVEASVLFLTVRTIAELLPVPDSRRSTSRVSLFSQREIIFNCIAVYNSISRRGSSIFSSPKYRAKDIPCTLSLCHRSKASMPITFSYIDLAAPISIL